MEKFSIKDVREVYMNNNVYVPSDMQEFIKSLIILQAERGNGRMYLRDYTMESVFGEAYNIDMKRSITIHYRMHGFGVDWFSKSLEFYGWADVTPGLQGGL